VSQFGCQCETDEGRLGSGFEQLLAIRLMVSRQAEHQALGGLNSVASDELGENMRLLFGLLDHLRLGGEPLAFDQQPYIAGVPKGLRPVSRTGHQNISVIPREIADGEGVLIARLAARVVQQHQRPLTIRCSGDCSSGLPTALAEANTFASF
jgi:hypothetical protein